MTKQRTKEIAVAFAAAGAICLAALAGLLMTWHAYVSHETPDVLPEAPYRGLPFILQDRHLTSWEGMSGGATADARKVRTIVIPAPGTPFPATRTPVEGGK